MTDYNVGIKVTADTGGAKQVSAAFAEVRREADSTTTSVNRSTSGIAGGLDTANAKTGLLTGSVKQLGGAFVALVAVDRLADIASGMIAAYSETEKFNAVLKASTGTYEEAGKKLAELRKFAAETPYDLAQAVDGFVKLKNMGLDPSISSLRSYGNTAAAMGKDLSQMIEAVADAAVGSFERLPEFGIKASVEGDKVKMIFQGVTTQINNDSKSIQKYLLDIGNVQFASAMAEQANTLSGKMSSLSDNVKELSARFVEQTGIANAVKSAIEGVSDAVQGLNKDLANVIQSPDELLSSLIGDNQSQALQQIKELTNEFKTASQERRAAIRNDLLDYFETLRDEQTALIKKIGDINTATNLPLIGGMAAADMAEYRRQLGAVTAGLVVARQTFREIGDLINPPKSDYWEKYNRDLGFVSQSLSALPDAATFTKPAWDSMAVGAERSVVAADKVSKSIADWLPVTMQYKDQIAAAVAEFGNLDEAIVKAMMAQESLIAAKKRGVSPETIQSGKGAIGLMQLMPATFEEVTKKLGMTGASIYNASDNIRAGAAYLSQMLAATGGDMEKALAAYNAGLGRVQQYGGIPPFKETQNYVANIMASYKQLNGSKAREDKQYVADHQRLERQAEQDTTKILRDAGVAYQKSLQQRAAIDQAAVEDKAARKLAEVDAEEQASRERQQMGIQSAQQTLAQDQQFENRRYQIRLQALRAKLALEKQDPDKNPVAAAQLNMQMQQLEQQHQLKLMQIRRQSYFQSRQLAADFVRSSTAGIQQSIAGVLTFSTSIGEGVKGMFSAVASAAANIIAEIAARWLTNTIITAIYGKANALTQIGANAAAAGSGAYAATAMIPMIGPALAPAAAATAYTGAMSFAASIPAAAKGFDIPSGLNPVT